MLVLRAMLAVCMMFALSASARADDPIVGAWAGTAKQDDGEPFEMRLTFVSPRGGISRYPGSPCGGYLTGGPKGRVYKYTEEITWGTKGELESYCIGGNVEIEVDGEKMKFKWSNTENGVETHTVGELKRRPSR
jgi:hypothetical protein